MSNAEVIMGVVSLAVSFCAMGFSLLASYNISKCASAGDDVKKHFEKADINLDQHMDFDEEVLNNTIETFDD